MLAKWIEANVILPEGLCAKPGRMKLWPYQREIADCIGDPSIERVTLVKAARIGFSVLVAAAVGHFTTNDPSPVICRLRTAVTSWRRTSSRFSWQARRSPGSCGISRVPRNLRAKTARVLFIDEADAMDMTGEGSSVELATKRTLTFSDRKIVLGSTPVVEETGHVCKAFESSDMRVFEVPCPACGAFTEIRWRHIEWKPDEPASAGFRCPHCNALVERVGASDPMPYKASKVRSYWPSATPWTGVSACIENGVRS
jgi:phage terminase large subunit GpA-like protein